MPLILASASPIRAQLLTNAGLIFETVPARVDEQAVKASLLVEGVSPRDIADALAEFKARKVADRNPDAMVIGCDQVLAFDGGVFSKPDSHDTAKAQLRAMAGQTHRLLSAAVIYDEGKPVWRHVAEVRMHMRPLSDTFIDDYVTRNWDSVRHSVGAYKLEEEGARLFTRIEGDYFAVLGLPLLDLLSYLTVRGILPS